MEPITTSLALKLAGSVTSRMADVVTPAVKRYFVKWKSASNKKALARAIKHLATVKTLLHVDEEVDISTFYYPSRISVGSESRAAKSVSEIGDPRNYILQGTVGQGKSIFLRFLAIEEVRQAKRIPIFFELRRVLLCGNLAAGINEVLLSYGFAEPETVFEALAESGLAILFLDGFDEVPATAVESVFNDIENLAKRFSSLQIIVTSRPDGGLAASPHFRVVKLAPLEKADHEPFLSMVLNDKEQRDALLARIQKSPAGIQALLQTPLTLSLLVLVYRSEYDIPPTLAGFYAHLFWAILARHEKSKMGGHRRRKCEIGDRELEELFAAFCFCAKLKGHVSFDHPTFHEVIGIAKDQLKIDCDATYLLEDFTKNVCLLSQEGLEFKFVHQSVQEYFAAAYVKSRTAEFASKFYSRVSVGDHWRRWQQELSFLAEIDRYRYVKDFLIPQLEGLFERTLPGITTADWVAVRQLIDGMQANIVSEGGVIRLHSVVIGQVSFADNGFRMLLVMDPKVMSKIFSGPGPIANAELFRVKFPQLSDGSNAIRFDQYLEFLELKESICEIASRLLKETRERYESAKKYLNEEQSKVLILE